MKETIDMEDRRTLSEIEYLKTEQDQKEIKVYHMPNLFNLGKMQKITLKGGSTADFNGESPGFET